MSMVSELQQVLHEIEQKRDSIPLREYIDGLMAADGAAEPAKPTVVEEIEAAMEGEDADARPAPKKRKTAKK